MRIKEILNQQHKTNKWLAEKTNLSEIGIGKIVMGKTSPTSDTIQKIAKALDVPCGALFDDYETHHDCTLSCPKCGYEIKLKAE